jgi:hypothetical protein
MDGGSDRWYELCRCQFVPIDAGKECVIAHRVAARVTQSARLILDQQRFEERQRMLGQVCKLIVQRLFLFDLRKHLRPVIGPEGWLVCVCVLCNQSACVVSERFVRVSQSKQQSPNLLCQHDECQDAQGPVVDAICMAKLDKHLRSKVECRARVRHDAFVGSGDFVRQTKVCDANVAIVIQKKILHLQISVHARYTARSARCIVAQSRQW